MLSLLVIGQSEVNVKLVGNIIFLYANYKFIIFIMFIIAGELIICTNAQNKKQKWFGLLLYIF